MVGMPTAYLVTGDSDTAAHPIAHELVIGRGEQADLLLSDATVSRRHASVRQDGHTVVVTDLGSANGTYVNERPVHEGTRVEDGDVIRLGAAELRVRVDGRAPEQPTPTEILSPPGS
jgi:pSer/pThr/pTyr-binding forkhead associated (FHA) protein